jgi:hypothetical protein
VILGAFDYSGGSLRGYTEDESVDQVGKKEFLRKNRRIPVEQTIAELGEGRGKQHFVNSHHSRLTNTGIYGPGYEERRRERLKAKYGYDLTGVPSAH